MSVLSSLLGDYADDIAKGVAKTASSKADDLARLIAPKKAINAVGKRLSGDKLLDATDLINEVRSVGGNVDDFGNVKLFHRTTPEAAKQIQDTGKMFGKENGLFFSTAKNGVNNSQYGKGIVEMDIPVENLLLDDIFSDEASIRLPLDRAGQYADVSDFISKPNKTAPKTIVPDDEIIPLFRGQKYGVDDLLYNKTGGAGSTASVGNAYYFTPNKGKAGSWADAGVIEIPAKKSDMITLNELIKRAKEADKIFSDSKLAENFYRNNPSEYDLMEAFANRNYRDISELTGKPFIQPDSGQGEELMETLFFPDTNPELTRQYRNMLKDSNLRKLINP